MAYASATSNFGSEVVWSDNTQVNDDINDVLFTNVNPEDIMVDNYTSGSSSFNIEPQPINKSLENLLEGLL